MPVTIYHREMSDIVSTSGTSSAESIQDVRRNNTVMIYIDYTRGDESGATIKCYVEDASIPGKWFQDAYMSGNSLIPKKIVVTESGKYRIPIFLSDREHRIKVEASLGGSPSNPGTLLIWLEPVNIGDE